MEKLGYALLSALVVTTFLMLRVIIPLEHEREQFEARWANSPCAKLEVHPMTGERLGQ